MTTKSRVTRKPPAETASKPEPRTKAAVASPWSQPAGLGRKKRREATTEGTGRRAARGGLGGRTVLPMHEALGNHPLVPKVANPSPTLTSKQQRFLQVLTRHLARDNPWVRNTITVATDQRIGTGPMPVSPFDHLNQAFRRWMAHADPRGDYAWGDLNREAYREKLITGDPFIRVRSRLDTPGYEDLPVPVQVDLLPSEFCPIDFDRTFGDLEFKCGIARDKRSRVVFYAFHTENPLEPTAGVRNPVFLKAKEIFHLAERRLGCPRGEVMLASAIMRAIKMAALEDAEIKRKLVATLTSAFVTRPVDASDDESMLPTEEEVGKLIDAIALSPGGIFELPYGYKLETFMPKDEPMNFDRALKWQLMAMCAAIGVLPHEVIGELDIVERLGRYINLIQERAASIMHRTWEFQFLNPFWRVFVDHVVASRQWTPPEDLDEGKLYDVTWEWDLIPLAAFKQELDAHIAAEESGIIYKGYTTKTMYDLDPHKVALERAKEAAREKAIASLAAEFEAEALADLKAELALAKA